MSLYKLIYSSEPFGFDESILIHVLMQARRRNAQDGLTGALVCRADVYLQMLEGPKDKVLETMGRIRADDRHLNVRVRVSEASQTRMFPKWAMHHDPMATWHWTQAEVASGVLDRAGPDQYRAIFRRLARTVAEAG